MSKAFNTYSFYQGGKIVQTMDINIMYNHNIKFYKKEVTRISR